MGTLYLNSGLFLSITGFPRKGGGSKSQIITPGKDELNLMQFYYQSLFLKEAYYIGAWFQSKPKAEAGGSSL